jgi:hypothetical protein
VELLSSLVQFEHGGVRVKNKPLPKPKGKGGRPRLDIDPAQVERMAAIGCTVEEIAVLVGCSKSTLDKGFSAPIEKGRMRLNRSLKRKQVQLARQGNVTMLIWLGKQYLGQKEKSESVVREEVITIEEIAPKVQHDA